MNSEQFSAPAAQHGERMAMATSRSFSELMSLMPIIFPKQNICGYGYVPWNF